MQLIFFTPIFLEMRDEANFKILDENPHFYCRFGVYQGTFLFLTDGAKIGIIRC